MGAYTDDKGNTKCENEESCENFGLSWNLPYKYENGVLTVTNNPARFYWKKYLNGGTKNFNLDNP